MHFFVYGRDRSGSGQARDEFTEAHWAYMDGYAEALIARGPTLDPRRETATGSVHIVDVVGVDEARRFALEDPYYLAGVFADILVRRWKSLLGTTMWDFNGEGKDRPRFLILGTGRAGATAERDRLREAHLDHLLGAHRRRLIACGPLLSDDGEEWLGSAILLEMPERGAVEAMVAADPYVKANLYADLEIHDWEFGGRR